MFKLSQLHEASATGQIEHGGLSIEFPISLERGAAASEQLAAILSDERALRERMAAREDAVNLLLENAESVVTPDMGTVVEFRGKIGAALGQVVLALHPEEVEGAKSKAKPQTDEALRVARETLENLDGWSADLLVTTEQFQAAQERAVGIAREHADESTQAVADLHALKARRIAFWCPQWDAADEGESLEQSLAKHSPALLEKLEGEIEKKAPGRSRLR